MSEISVVRKVKIVDENNKSMLPDEEMEQVAGGYGMPGGRNCFDPSGKMKKHISDKLEWSYCNNANTARCFEECKFYFNNTCADGWMEVRKY